MNNNNNNLMYLLAVGGISIAIALGGAGLGIALKNKSTTDAKVDIESPYAFGKISDADIPGVKKAYETADSNVKSFGAFKANDEQTLVESDFWKKVDDIKLPIQKATKGIKVNGVVKNAANLKNTITFTLTTTGTNSFNDAASGDFTVEETWNKDGKVVYTLKSDGVKSKLGTGGKAATDLFGGKIKKDTKLDKYLLLKVGGLANVNGSDANFVVYVDDSGNIKIISKAKTDDKAVKLTVKTGKRSTTL